MDFNSILIGSEDPARLVEYYTRVFGEPAMSDESYTGWQLGSGFIGVGPHSEVHGRNAEPGRVLWNIETPDVQAEFDRIRAAGGIVVTEPYSLGGDAPGVPTMMIATFEDPDGNYFQLMSPYQP